MAVRISVRPMVAGSVDAKVLEKEMLLLLIQGDVEIDAMAGRCSSS